MPTEEIPQTLEWLRAQRQKIMGPNMIQVAGNHLLTIIRQILPYNLGEETGHLKQSLLENSGPVSVGEGWQFGVGNLERLGSPQEYSPKGTIKDFLKWWDTTHQRQKTEKRERRKGAELRYYVRQEEVKIRRAQRVKFDTGGRGKALTYRQFLKPLKGGSTRLSKMREHIEGLNERIAKMEANAQAGVIRGQEARVRVRRARLLAIYHAVNDQTDRIETSRYKIRGYRRRLSSLGFN